MHAWDDYGTFTVYCIFSFLNSRDAVLSLTVSPWGVVCGSAGSPRYQHAGYIKPQIRRLRIFPLCLCLAKFIFYWYPIYHFVLTCFVYFLVINLWVILNDVTQHWPMAIEQSGGADVCRVLQRLFWMVDIISFLACISCYSLIWSAPWSSWDLMNWR